MLSPSLQQMISSSLSSARPLWRRHSMLINSGRISAIALWLTVSNAAYAQSTTPSIINTIERTTQTQVRYAPPPGTTTPASSGGTGSRGGECPQQEEALPLASLSGQQHLSWTASDRSTIWIYVPYTPAEAPSGTLTLEMVGADESSYKGTFALTNTPGVVGINIPDAAPPLEVDTYYSWYINITCAPTTPAFLQTPGESVVPAVLEGLIKRVAVTEELSDELDTATNELDRVAVYGEHHLWYDMLTELARLRLAADDSDADGGTGVDELVETNTVETNETSDASIAQDLKAIWVDLLSNVETVNLPEFTEAPLVGEITPTEVIENDESEIEAEPVRLYPNR